MKKTRLVPIYLFLFCLHLNHLSVLSQQLDIGILNNQNAQKLLIEASVGKYKVKSGSKTICRLHQKNSILINLSNGFIQVDTEKKNHGLHKEIFIQAKKYKYHQAHDKKDSKKNAELQIKLIEPKLNTRTYQGNVQIVAGEKALKLINRVAMPDYLAGVVEAESGSRAEPEYYKNQAVIARTYALKSLDKHKKEGYHLCDGVHCQAYKGKSTTNPQIQLAVKKTKDLVIVDNKGELISALYSANCGGQTNHSEDVWSSSLPYLRSKPDEFCTDQPQAKWTKTILWTDFKNFLKEKKLTIPDTLSIDSFAFSQPERKVNYIIMGQEIPLTSIRFGLNLRSAFFEIKPEGQSLLFTGRGYGHGVGMCQEGAMNMARKGYRFDEIIRYYYKDVKILPFAKIKN
jgi:stage II sporulation protein D